jgi:UPF0716 family protein affecting phage T7 exclusion
MASGAKPKGSLLEYVVIVVTGALALVFALAVPGFATLGNLSVAATGWGSW